MNLQSPQFDDPNVAAYFDRLSMNDRAALDRLRALIFDVARGLPQTGGLNETLKWGQPAYLPIKPRVGTTIRIATNKTDGTALYAHCQTSVISDFRAIFGDDFTFEANRAVHFTSADAIDADKLRLLIKSALTYHQKAAA